MGSFLPVGAERYCFVVCILVEAIETGRYLLSYYLPPRWSRNDHCRHSSFRRSKETTSAHHQQLKFNDERTMPLYDYC